jgi:hypothetical protein
VLSPGAEVLEKNHLHRLNCCGTEGVTCQRLEAAKGLDHGGSRGSVKLGGELPQVKVSGATWVRREDLKAFIGKRTGR